MSARSTSGPGPVLMLLVLAVLLLGTGAFLFGPSTAWDLARTSVARVLVDGVIAGQEGRSLPSLVVDTDGGDEDEVTCQVVQGGVGYTGRWLRSDASSWDLLLDSVSPWSGVRSIRLMRPGDPSRIAWRTDLDMAGLLGLATARVELMHLVLDDRPVGLVLWGEVVGPDVERIRNLHERDVVVLSCPSGAPWSADADWTMEGAIAEGANVMEDVLSLLHDPGSPDSLKVDSLVKLIDADSFLRLRVWEELILQGQRIAPKLVAGLPSGRLYPMVDAFPRMVADSLIGPDITDLLVTDPARSARLNELRKEARTLFLDRGVRERRVLELAMGLAPHVARDHEARFLLPGLGEVPVRTSVLEWRTAVIDLLNERRPDHGS